MSDVTFSGKLDFRSNTGVQEIYCVRPDRSAVGSVICDAAEMVTLLNRLPCPPCSVQQPAGPGQEDCAGEARGGGGHPEEGGVRLRPSPAAGRCPLHDQAAGGEGGPGEELHEERLGTDHTVRRHCRDRPQGQWVAKGEWNVS